MAGEQRPGTTQVPAPLVVAGVGIGCTFASMITVAMRNVSPALAGAASGVFNTNRQVGTVIGTAGVGALLQNRLLAGFTAQTQLYGAHLPAAVRARLLAGFQAAAKGGFVTGTGNRGNRLTELVFTHGFIEAMRPTIIVPILFLLAAAVCCLFVKRRSASDDGVAHEVTEPTAATAG